jgi:hypothetical protein
MPRHRSLASLALVSLFASACSVLFEPGDGDGAGDDALACIEGCSPASDCVDSGCACPEGVVPEVVAGASFLYSEDGLRYAVGRFFATGAHQTVVLAYDPASTPVGVPIFLSPLAAPLVALRYQDDFPHEPRAAFLAVSGSLTLTRACADGIAGTVEAAEFVEWDLDWQSWQPWPEACSLSVTRTSFDIGGPCD